MSSQDPGARRSRIRRARPGDAASLVALVESAYRGDASRRGWTTEADLLDGQRIDLSMMQAVLHDPDTVVLVADGDTATGDTPPGAGGRALEPLGCCEVRRVGDAEASFGMFAVDPERQGGGTGAALLAAAELTAANQLGARRMTMWVIEQRLELVAWYERRGYRATGRHHPFPYGDERFGRPRRDDLRFTVLAKDLGAAPVGCGS